MEYSREGSKADGANPSEAVLGIWACTTPSGNTRPRQFGPVMSSSGNTRPRQFGPVMSPFGNTRPRDYDASPDPRFLAPCPRGSLAKYRQKLPLTVPEGAEGSKMLLFDERCDSSVDYGNSVQLIMLEDVASPLARRAVSVLLPAPLVATLPDHAG